MIKMSLSQWRVRFDLWLRRMRLGHKKMSLMKKTLSPVLGLEGLVPIYQKAA